GTMGGPGLRWVGVRSGLVAAWWPSMVKGRGLPRCVRATGGRAAGVFIGVSCIRSATSGGKKNGAGKSHDQRRGRGSGSECGGDRIHALGGDVEGASPATGRDLVAGDEL